MIEDNLTLCIDEKDSWNALRSKGRLDFTVVVEVTPWIVHFKQVGLGSYRVVRHVYRHDGQPNWANLVIQACQINETRNAGPAPGCP